MKKPSANCSDYLKVLRVQRGLSQTELAALVGVSQAAIGQWERGVSNPKGKHLLALAKALAVEAKLLINVTKIGSREAIPNDGLPHVDADRGPIAETVLRETDFVGEVEMFLKTMSIRGRMRQSVSGPLSNRWQVDYLSDKAIVDFIHRPVPPSGQETLFNSLTHALWHLSTLRAFFKDDRQTVLICHLPGGVSGEGVAEGTPEIVRLQKLIAEASLVNIGLCIVDSPKQAAHIIQALEKE